MIQIRRILLPTDFFNCANQALEHAVYLAKRFKAELLLFHAIVLQEYDPQNPAYRLPDFETLAAQLKALAEQQMSAAVEAHRDGRLRIETVQQRGFSAADTILEFARDRDVDLIVMGTHGRRGIGRLLLGSVAERVLRFSRCPVLTIREQADPESVDRTERILVPVDFSEHARCAVAHAREIAGMYGATLNLLHVVEESVYPPFYYARKRPDVFDIRPNIKARSESALEQLFEEVPGPDVDCEIHCFEGHPAKAIARFAELNRSDLIVIATQGLTGLSRMLLGNVSRRVIRRAPCPVFTVKSSGRSLVA